MTATCRGIFVTGTDTGVGKTVAAVALLQGCVAQGLRAVGMKPVATGIAPGAEYQEDVAALAAAGNIIAPLADRNPYAFAATAAPHLAAAQVGRAIRVDAIAAAYGRLAEQADVVVVEGAGGALVPLDDRMDMLDIPRALGIPVVLVVGLRLGCLSHARMTALAIGTRGLKLAGWIACRIDPGMACADENLRWLARELPAPLVADLVRPGALDATALRRLGVL